MGRTSTAFLDSIYFQKQLKRLERAEKRNGERGEIPVAPAYRSGFSGGQ